MDANLKNSYMAGGIFTFVGILFLYVGFTGNDAPNSLILIFGFLLGGTGLASFKFPQIGEVLFHWLQQQDKPKSHSVKQHQNKPRNSPQAYTGSGDVTINYNNSNRRRRKK